jgi:hypothetical protein
MGTAPARLRTAQEWFQLCRQSGDVSIGRLSPLPAVDHSQHARAQAKGDQVEYDCRSQHSPLARRREQRKAPKSKDAGLSLGERVSRRHLSGLQWILLGDWRNDPGRGRSEVSQFPVTKLLRCSRQPLDRAVLQGLPRRVRTGVLADIMDMVTIKGLTGR